MSDWNSEQNQWSAGNSGAPTPPPGSSVGQPTDAYSQPAGEYGQAQGAFPPPGAPNAYPPGGGFDQTGYQPPSSSSGGSKVLWIILGVIGVLILLGIILTVVFVNLASNVVGDVTDDFEIVADTFAEVSSGDILNETGSVMGGGEQSHTFTLSARTTVQIDVVGINDFDPMMDLYNDGEWINSNDDGGECFDSQLIMPLDPGTYQVVVSSWDGDSGEYRVVVGSR